MKNRPERQIALLRGINVGKAKRIAMADLRAVVEGLGFRDVSTLLNSGNVVFSSPGIAARDAASRIEKAVKAKLGISARVIVISAADLIEAIGANPLLEIAANPSRMLVAFLSTAEHRNRLTPLVERDWSPEAFALGQHVAYMWCPAGVIESALANEIGKILGDAVTTRNWATVLKLQGLAGE